MSGAGQHESGFPKIPISAGDLELSDQAYTLFALLCKDEACAHVRSAETAIKHGEPS